MSVKLAAVEELFAAASALPVEERGAYRDGACTGDAAVRAEVEALLAAALGATDALGAVVGRAAVGALGGSAAGRRRGAYRLLEERVAGGMGAVYRAARADDQYRSRVAIKVLHQGLETAAAVARFRDERQILAGLDHPGIVRLLDGGSTEAGLPFLVMDHVDGVPITSWDAKRRLPPPGHVDLVR